MALMQEYRMILAHPPKHWESEHIVRYQLISPILKVVSSKGTSFVQS